METKNFTEKILTMLEKLSDLDEIVTVKVKEFIFGTTRCKSFTEPAKIDKKIMRSTYPKGWNPESPECYNEWCADNSVSTVYHIKQTNNIEWK